MEITQAQFNIFRLLTKKHEMQMAVAGLNANDNMVCLRGYLYGDVMNGIPVYGRAATFEEAIAELARNIERQKDRKKARINSLKAQIAELEGAA